MKSTVNQRIKILRESLNCSQREFAETIGVVQKTIWQVETEETMPSYKVLVGIIGAYQVRSEWLLEGVEPMFKTDEKQSASHSYPHLAETETRPLAVAEKEGVYAPAILKKYLQEMADLLERIRKEIGE